MPLSCTETAGADYLRTSAHPVQGPAPSRGRAQVTAQALIGLQIRHFVSKGSDVEEEHSEPQGRSVRGVTG